MWVKDRFGGLVNLALSHRIVISKSIVGAFFLGSDGAFELFAGTPEECGRFLDMLLAKLQENQRHVHEF